MFSVGMSAARSNNRLVRRVTLVATRRAPRGKTGTLGSMAIDAANIQRLFDEQVARIVDPTVSALVQRWRVAPRCELRLWSYAAVNLPCWLVLEDKELNVGVAYCEHGFGPKCPWGLLRLTGHRVHMGDDSQWFPTLEQAVRDMVPVRR
jgi:hypothetical protein